jgi:hypothetical protein
MNIERYSRHPPMSAPRRFEPSDIDGSGDSLNSVEKMMPANRTGSAFSSPPIKPRCQSGRSSNMPGRRR